MGENTPLYKAVLLKPVRQHIYGCVPNRTHLTPITSSLVETARLELGAHDEGGMQHVQWWGIEDEA